MAKLTLRAARVNAGLTQAKVAELTNHTVATICNWEKGNTMPRTNDLVELAKLYRVEVADFNLL